MAVIPIDNTTISGLIDTFIITFRISANVNIDKNKHIANITIDENIGVILNKIYDFLSKSQLKLNPIKLNIPIAAIIKIIYKSPQNILFNTILLEISSSFHPSSPYFDYLQFYILKVSLLVHHYNFLVFSVFCVLYSYNIK